MDRKLARKNIRSGLIAGAICLVHVRDHVRRRGDLRPPVSLEDGAGAETDAPPAGEEIHLPGPSLIPFVCAIAITLIVIGTTIDWIFSIVGLIVIVVVAVSWIRDTRRDIDALPEEHH